ncbi:hypothetical protein DPMN_084259 [Dreissena polymorpha]|uniref:Uncharacterized protein n=1 Tax=Dreissena polymorpha TaxID=45954 RepID=A0A9D3YE84_DREPO|nr:hypothetical protein DPMN_084259 [Dreissena polymorpha]
MQTPIVLLQEAPVNNGDSKDSIDDFTSWSNSYEYRTTRQDIACDDDFCPTPMTILIPFVISMSTRLL